MSLCIQLYRNNDDITNVGCLACLLIVQLFIQCYPKISIYRYFWVALNKQLCYIYITYAGFKRRFQIFVLHFPGQWLQQRWVVCLLSTTRGLLRLRLHCLHPLHQCLTPIHVCSLCLHWRLKSTSVWAVLQWQISCHHYSEVRT